MDIRPRRTVSSEKRDLIALTLSKVIPRVWRLAWDAPKATMRQDFDALKIGHRLEPSFEMILYKDRLEVNYLGEQFAANWEVEKGRTKPTNFILTTNWGDDDRVLANCLEALMDHVVKMSQRVSF